MCSKPVPMMIKGVSNQIKRLFDKRANQGAGELTGMNYAIINFVANNRKKGDIFQRDVEEEFNVRGPTATRILQLMEKKELIIREPVEGDGRLKRIVPTAKGTELAEENMLFMKKIDENILAGISDEDIEILKRAITKMSENLDKMI